MSAASNNTVWASVLAFACILFVLGLLLCIPFVLARMRGVNPRVDRMMDSVASFMGADPPSMSGKAAKQPAPRDFLSKLKVTKYAQPQDLEAGAAEDCCAICVCDYEAGQPCITLSCGHLFHKDCILAWLKVDAVCPMCKTQLLPQPQQAKAPDCRCGQSSSGQTPQQAQPAPATAARSAPAGAPAEQECAQASQDSSASTAAPAAAHEPGPVASPRVLPLALQPHAFSSPMLGVAGVSP